MGFAGPCVLAGCVAIVRSLPLILPVPVDEASAYVANQIIAAPIRHRAASGCACCRGEIGILVRPTDRAMPNSYLLEVCWVAQFLEHTPKARFLEPDLALHAVLEFDEQRQRPDWLNGNDINQMAHYITPTARSDWASCPAGTDPNRLSIRPDAVLPSPAPRARSCASDHRPESQGYWMSIEAFIPSFVRT